jgi:diacylglycerol kinase (ATP)
MNALEQSQQSLPESSAATGISSVLLVVNPASRAGQRALSPVVMALRAAGVAHRIVETRCAGDATRLVREHLTNTHSYDAVFTLGGDGTAMEAATALAGIENAPPLGIIAVGTANVLARSIGLPMRPQDAVRSLLDCQTMSIDLGRVAGGPAFAIGLGIGLDASMISGASAQMKRRVGYFAYAFAAMRAGLKLERFRASIEVDGVVHEVETSSILVANFGTVLGDMICFGDGIAHHDGKLDVCVYSPRSVLDAGRIFWRMMFGGLGDDRCVRTIRGERIRITTTPPRPLQADGEMLGMTPVDVQVEPRAVRVLSPRVPVRRWRFRRTAASPMQHQLQSAAP